MATIKQKKAFDKILENRGNVSKSLKEAGYSDAYAKNPQQFIKTQAYQEWLDKFDHQISDASLIKVHKEGLKASRKIFKNNNESGEIEMVSEEPDHAVRHKFLETAYKIKGYEKSNDPPPQQLNQFNFSSMTNEQLDITIKRITQAITPREGQETGENR
jgi:uncharacterized protein with von Willebrand factor type A (vWA) domain